MSNSEYWQRRFELLEEAQNNQRTEYLDLLKEEYEKSLSRIEKDITNWYTRIADNNEISFDNAKKLLDKKELKEFKWTVEEYIEKGRENAINQKWMKELENTSAKVHIDKLESIKIQIQNELELLHNKQDKDVENLVKHQYQESYYKSAYEIQKGLENFKNIQSLDINKIEKIISKPWTTDNQTFSDRIWKHKEELVNTLQKDLTQATIRGDDLNKITKKIEKDFEVSRGKAGRLVMTESAFFSSAGQKECFNSLNVKQYEIVATLDSHTSEICQNLDGKVFDMKDYEVGITAPPFHCWCRSTTAPYFDDEFTEGEQRAYRDEDRKAKYVDSKMKYQEWYDKYVTNSDNLLKNTSSNDKINRNIDKKEEKMNYQDITNQYNIKQQYQIKKQKYFIDNDGNKYRVDGRQVMLKPTEREIEVAKILGQTFGGKVKLIPVVLQPKGVQTPDYIINNQKFDLKQILGNGKNTLDTAINKKRKQANNFIFDITKTKMEEEQVLLQVDKIYNAKNRTWVNKIILLKDKEILKIFKRK